MSGRPAVVVGLIFCANLPWALLASAVVTLGGVWFAGDRLRSFALTGDE